ncbi:hypothetical protein [Staphylococcus gallinarum]|uniref:hypothetical protein n=1 Tax=Staphylococcus gallinarum TaxID=1293 RepID=UPI0030BF3BE8
MAEERNKEKEFFRKRDDRLYFSIPSNDKQRKTFAGLDGIGFVYLIGALIPVVVLGFIMVYFIQFKGVEFDAKFLYLIIFFMLFYVAIAWTLCSHDSATGKQTFSVLYQMVKYRVLQPKMTRPKFANRKNTILKIEVAKDNENTKEERTITTDDINRRRQQLQHREQEFKLTDTKGNAEKT